MAFKWLNGIIAKASGSALAVDASAVDGNAVQGTATTTTASPGNAGVYGVDSGASSGTADGVYGHISGSGSAIHGVSIGTGVTGKAGFFQASNVSNTADAVAITQAGSGKGLNVSASYSANSSDALVVAHAGTGKGLNVTTSLITNSSATGLITQAGTGKILDLVGSLTTAVANAVNLVVAGITGHGLFVSMTNAGATGDAVLAQNSGTGVALHGKALSTGKALHAEGPATISGAITAQSTIAVTGAATLSGGATLINGKNASSVVMLATPQRVLSNLTLAATTYTYVAVEGSFTTNGQTVAIPSNAVAVMGSFITVPNGSSVANSFLAAFAANDAYTGTPGTTVAGISATGGAFQYSGATLPLGPGGASSKQGIKIYGSSSVQVYFDVYGYVTT